MVLFNNGFFTIDELDDRTANVLLAATDRAAQKVLPSDILHAAIVGDDPRIQRILTNALVDGAQLDHVRQVIEICGPPAGDRVDFDGSRERFSTKALEALDEFEAAVAERQHQDHDTGLELLLASVLTHLETRVVKSLTILDIEAAAKVLRDQADIEPPEPLFDTGSGRLRSATFTEAAWAVLERAGVRATELGYEHILPPHCLLALLGETEGLTERLVRLQVSPDIGPVKVAAAVADGFRRAESKRNPLVLRDDTIGEPTVALLRRAQKLARTWRAERVDTPHLLAALLDDPPPRLASILERDPLALDLAKLRRHLEQELREDSRGGARRETPFRFPTDLLPAEDLTYIARTEGIPPARHLDGHFEALTRALHRARNNHVLITGQPGVGRTTLVRELARRAAAGEIPFLRHKRFLWVDGGDVSIAESGRKLAAVISQVAGRTDLVLCLDKLGPLLRAESGGNHKLLLRGALKERRVHLVGVLDTYDYEELLSGDHALLELCNRVDMKEPDRDAALDIAGRIADELAREFGIGLEPKSVERAVVLSADYLLSDRLPSKAAKILRRACEDLDYERTQQGSDRTAVTVDDVVRVVSEITGVPRSQLSGVGSGGIDYAGALGDAVVGQPEAVAAVASELRLIKAGLRPGSVLFFAGQTGVGKTELAKALARFYSAAKRLQTYTMGNFTEGHMVSGITGVAPGYVGHERGGRLINDLIADPYCVFLLDEAEKAHPDIWKPFLNLFDEGWVEDQRGVRAFGDRAIFILTSNVGADAIATMSGQPQERLVEAVRERLLAKRHPKTQEPVFPPEFLARIRKIIVLRPLDGEAMTGICRMLLERRERFWLEQREKRLVIPEELVRYIAAESHAVNRKSGGKEGGRIVDKLISTYIEDVIVRAVESQPDEYQACQRIELSFAADDGAVEVAFRAGEPVGAAP